MNDSPMPLDTSLSEAKTTSTILLGLATLCMPFWRRMPFGVLTFFGIVVRCGEGEVGG